MRIIYLYGFSSGPQSTKAQFFKRKFAGFSKKVNFVIFDSIPNKRSFTFLKTSKILFRLGSFVEKESQEEVILIGSSYGAFLSLWYAVEHQNNIDKLILIAPALEFSAKYILNQLQISIQEWKNNDVIFIGNYRYKTKVPLTYTFLEDLLINSPPDFYNLEFSIPTLIFHGKNDEVCPIDWSLKFASIYESVKLNILDSDHQLLNQTETIWKRMKYFLKL